MASLFDTKVVGALCGVFDPASPASPGLTILAYRYEGLRMSDFKAGLRALKEEMEDEQSGPYHTRPACQMFVRWVTLSGGTVRGVRRRRNTNGEAR